MSRDKPVGIAMGYGPDDQGSIPGRGSFSPLHSVQICSNGHRG
jgi:hypothetical protein